MMRRLCLLALLVALATVIGSTPALAQPATPSYAPIFGQVSAPGFVLTSGSLALVADTNGDQSMATAATLINEQTGTRTAIPIPTACLPRGLGPSAIVYQCYALGAPLGLIYHLETGTTTPMSAFGAAVRVGTWWAEVDGSGGSPHVGAGVSYVNLATGAVLPGFQRAKGRTYADLDSPALKQTTCAPVRVPAEMDPETSTFRAARLFFLGGVAVETNLAGDARTRLQRCGSHKIYSYKTGAPFAINSKILVWPKQLGELQGVYLKSHHHFTIKLRQASLATAVIENLALTHNSLYVEPEGNFSVWTAKLPSRLR
jgi:hypothetical protein